MSEIEVWPAVNKKKHGYCRPPILLMWLCAHQHLIEQGLWFGCMKHAMSIPSSLLFRTLPNIITSTMSFPVVFVYLFNAEEVRELSLLCAYLFFFPSKKKKANLPIDTKPP